MNIATLLTEKNNEYLKLLQACSKSEKALSDRLFAVTNDISKAEADLEKRVAEINAELTAKAEALIVDSNDEIKINVEKIKQQRDVFCANEEQRRADILKRYKLKLSQIEEELKHSGCSIMLSKVAFRLPVSSFPGDSETS